MVNIRVRNRRKKIKEEAKKRANNAYKWVSEEMDWQKHIVPKWVALFDKASQEIKTRSIESLDASNKTLEAESF